MKKTLTLKIDFSCSGCAQNIEKALSKLNLIDFMVNSISQEVEIEYDSNVIDESTIFAAIKKTGYKYEMI